MKIMVISPIASHQPTGGAKRRIYNLLKYLQKQGHSVDYVYTCHETTDLEHAVTLMQGDWDSVTVIPSDIDYTQKSLSADYGVDDWIEPGSGERVTELMKQKQYAPQSVAEMGLLLYAANEGYLKAVEVEKVADFEAALLSYMHAEHGALMQEIANDGNWNDDREAAFKSGLDTFVSTQTW